MLGAPGALQSANVSVGDPVGLGAGAAVPWHALLAAALLALGLGGVLFEGLSSQRSSVAPSLHPSRALHPGRTQHQLGLSSLPAAAQGPISAALGAEDPAYRVRPSSAGFAASNTAQRFSLRFDRSGVSLSSGATHVGLSLRAVGYGSSLAAVDRVVPRVRANRVVYTRTDLSESYVNGPIGLEQGFTIPRAPAAHPAGPLTLSMALTGNAHASLAAGGQGVTLSRAGATVLRYKGLSVTDARGHAVHGWLELQAGRLLLRVDARNASYPLRIDPFVQQGEKLTGSGEKNEEGLFGYSVALSPEGKTALIGGYRDHRALGAAWVFTVSGSTWTQQGAKLTAKSGEQTGASEFGFSVALSAEGATTTAVIGGPGDHERVGAGWVFTRAEKTTTWTQQGTKLTAKSGEETGAGEFGFSVAVSAKEGSTALIGGERDKEGIGAAWVFTRSGSTWTQQGAKLVPKEAEETGAGEFGGSVALSAEGTTALIGAGSDKEGIGAAWVFTRASEKWTQQGTKLVAKSGEEIGEGEFGASVALSSKEANTALISAPQDSKGVGAAWVFTRASEKWTQQGAKLAAKSGEEIGEGLFGSSVALSAKDGEGTTALMGAPQDNKGVGAAWVFTRTGTAWTQQGTKLTGAAEAGEGLFGGSVSLSAEGTTALIGGAADNKNIGAAWVFTRSGSIWSQQGEKLTASGEIGEGEAPGKSELGFSVALSSEGATALIGGYRDNKNVGAAWVFTRTGTTWTQQGAKLTAKSGEEIGEGLFGSSVALSSKEGNTALIGAPQDNKGVGAAWVFTRSGEKWTQQGAKLVAKSPEEIGEGEFGSGAALSVEGTTAVIGAARDNSGIGAAWVFTRASEKWTQQGAKLVAKSGEETGEGHFGLSVTLSAKEGNTAVIGAPMNNGGIGAAWVFTRASEKWTQQGAKLVAKSGEETGAGEFAQSVSLSSEATTTTALIGASHDKEGIGAAWVFTRSGTSWTQQGTKLVPKEKEETGSGEFGASVALSPEGSTALIGAPRDNTSIGAVWFFTRSGSTWTEQGEKHTGSGEGGKGEFGASVALSAEGATTTALIGGAHDNSGVGAAWVFTRAEKTTTWTQQGEKLIGTGETGEPETGGQGAFGYSVALSSEGSTALIGGRSTLGSGAAWVFTRTGVTWTQQGLKLTAKADEESAGGEFGNSVALSANGNTALIGGSRDNGGVGAAWVFTRSGSTWTQQGAKLTAKSGEEAGAGEFGESVALSADGNTALMGSPSEGSGFTLNYGSAWVFTRASEKWTQQGEKLQGPSGEVGEGEFGWSVALSTKEGNTALIGGPGDNGKVGAAWVYTRTGSTWTQQGEKLTGSAESGAGEFGEAVTLSAGEGNTALIGGDRDKEGIGAAWVFTRASEKWAQQGEKLIPKSGEEIGAGEFGESVALSADANNTALIGAPQDNTNVGAAWVFTRASEKWTQQGAKLVAKSGEEIGEGLFGYGVALSSEGNTALIGGYGDNNAIGAAWVFVDTSPTVVTKPASAIAQTTATLNASVNPDGGEVTKCEFEYGTTVSYGKTAPCTPSPGSGTSPVAVSAAIAGLTANTSYHFRIVATNAGGESKGSDETFNTLVNPPTVTTEKAASVAQTSAVLKGKVNPNGAEVTKCEFEYGTTVSYGKTAPCTPSPGSGTSPVEVSATVTGLSANTTYHYRLVATNYAGTSDGADETVKTLPNPPTVATEKASAIKQTTATLNASVNPNGAEVTKCEFEYGTTVSYGKTASCSPAPGSGTSPVAVSAAITGLTANTSYHFRIVATNAGGESKGADETVKTAPNAPTVVTEKASAISQTTATLNATVNPNGGEVTTCEFEYGTTVAYGKSAPCFANPGSGTSPVAVVAGITGLTPAATYHFRIVATNAGGESKGGDETFKALPEVPVVVTEKASAVTQTTATLNATVNPNGGEVTECKFEYGTTGSYGKTAPCTPSPGSGTSPVAVSAAITGLTANTTYHFRIVATNAGGEETGFDTTLKTLPNAPTVVTEKASSIAQTTATLNASVNPNGGSVSKCEFEYGTTVSYGKTAPCTPSPGSGTSPVAVSAAITGLTANTTYHFRIVATNAGGESKGADETVKTAPNPPTVVTEKASAIAQTTATLNASVNPDGGEVTKCEFEYGTTVSYGKTAPCTPSPGSGTSPVAVSAAITGLTANTSYHFRIVATNAGGESKGSDETFKTLVNPPTVTTEKAASIAQTSAVLKGKVNPNGAEVTKCEFEYGTTVSYGKTAPCTPSPGSGTSPVEVSATVTGLSANTTYHYRLVATNYAGTSDGADETFKTLVSPPTVVTEKASAITQTTATLNATVNPNGAEVTKCEFEYGTTVSYGKTASCSPAPGSGTSPVAVSAAITGLTANTSYHFRIVATNAGGESKGSDETLKTAPNAPTVVTEKASAISQTTATLNATVNPNGGEVTECKFEYGTTVSYGKTAPCSPAPGSGTSPVAVSAAITGLTANTSYHFRIVATNAGGEGKGADETFKTLLGSPTVVTEKASAITQTTATLNATVNPNGQEVTRCEFEYGTTTAYGSTAPCAVMPGSGTSPVAVSAAISGLAADTAYHFRIVAVSAGGESKGSDETFTTLPSAPTVVTGSATATSGSATLNATVNPNGGAVSKCEFEYGTTVAYGKTAPCTPSPGSGTSPVAVSASVAGLAGNTTYHFRIVATNAGGEGKGADETFKTLSAPHWYKNAVKSKEGTKVQFISWGTLALKTVVGGSGEVTCHVVSAGNLSNPTGGGAGRTETMVFATYGCEQVGACPEGATVGVAAETLPWQATLEQTGGRIKANTEKVKLNVSCVGGKEPGGAKFVGSYAPSLQTGTSALHPAFLEFGAGSGALEKEGSAGAVKAEFEGQLKLLGYTAQELFFAE